MEENRYLNILTDIINNSNIEYKNYNQNDIHINKDLFKFKIISTNYKTIVLLLRRSNNKYKVLYKTIIKIDKDSKEMSNIIEWVCLDCFKKCFVYYMK